MKPISMKAIACRAKEAAFFLPLFSKEKKNKILLKMAKALLGKRKIILAANQKDVARARQKGLSFSMIKRLELTEAKLQLMADSIISIAKLPDPVGQVISTTRRPNGLLIKKVRVPIGVILIIYESRPNVTADCMALCFKSGNSVILKGGSEAFFSNQAIHEALNQAALKEGVPSGAFEFVATTERAAVGELLGLNEWIDLVIPRGGEGLIREVVNISKIPVIKHFKGVCHVFVDKEADLKKAAAIAINAKAQNPAVCNAMETLLVHEAVAKKFLPEICRQLKEKGVEIRGCKRTKALVPWTREAAEKDWYAEYLDLILAVKVVKNWKEAVYHIQKYGSHHSDAIVTRNQTTAAQFTKEVDSACVFVNCSTRFSDGGEFGMGAEMGISTDKLHARGPMGLVELTSYKYIVLGNGQIRG